MDHGSMVMPGMDHGAGKAPAQDHDDMKMPMKQADPLKNTSAMPGMSHGQSDSNAPIPAHNMGAMDRSGGEMDHGDMQMQGGSPPPDARDPDAYRSEEHTSELQSLMRISYAVFCLQPNIHT